MTTWYGPGTGHKVLHLIDCASHPSYMHLVKTLQQQLKWKALIMWSSYMYMALQMYVIGDVTIVVWHLYLFGYVLVVYVCVIVINVESSRRY